MPLALDLKFTAVWYIAYCKRCDMRLPFKDAETRDKWASGHDGLTDPFEGGGTHVIHRMVEIWED